MANSNGSLDGFLQLPSLVSVGYHTVILSGESYSGEQVEYYQNVVVYNQEGSIDSCSFIDAEVSYADNSELIDQCQQNKGKRKYPVRFVPKPGLINRELIGNYEKSAASRKENSRHDSIITNEQTRDKLKVKE